MPQKSFQKVAVTDSQNPRNINDARKGVWIIRRHNELSFSFLKAVLERIDMEYGSVRCVCDPDKPMDRLVSGEHRCPHCGLQVRLTTNIVPEDWYDTVPSSNQDFPYCVTCGRVMIYGSSGCEEIAGRYFLDLCFYCEPNEKHVVGAYFREISPTEYELLTDEMRKDLVDSCSEAKALDLMSGSLQGAHLVEIMPDGTRCVDVSGLTEQERDACLFACKSFEIAKLLERVQLSGPILSFKMTPRLAESLESVQVQQGTPNIQ